MVKPLRKNLSGLWVSTHDKVSDFYASSWQRGDSGIPMLVVRLLLAGLALSILTWSVVESATPFWLLYLTNWGLVMVSSLTLSGLLVSILATCNKINSDNDSLPWYISMYWLVFNVATSLALMITVLYWVLLFNPEAEQDPRMFWLDIMTHGVNSCIVTVEILMSRTPVRILHFYQPLGVGLWYAAFTAIYYLAGGTDANGNPYIYEVLDWNNRNQAGGIIGVSIGGIILLYLFLWGLSLGRDKLSSTLVRTKSHDLPFVPPDNASSRIA